MRGILEQLYNGELSPADKVVKGNAQYDALCRQSLQELETFSADLSRDKQEAFEQLMEHYLELTFIEKTQTFCDGFRIGAGIMCEVFNGQEQPLEQS